MSIENPQQAPGCEPGQGGAQEHSTPKPNGSGHAAKGTPGSAAALGLDLNVAIRALTAMNPDGYQHLAALNPVTGKHSGYQTFSPGQWREKRDWIEAQQDAGNNVYAGVNEPFPPGPKIGVDERPDKTQIAKIRNIVVDCDIAKSIQQTDAPKLKNARDKIDAALLVAASGMFTKSVPRIVADSGNGGHGVFNLPEPLAATPGNKEKAERAGRGLQQHFQKALGEDVSQVDSVWDLARIIRVPGTINFPDARKLKLGRVVVASKLLQPITDATATLEDILADYPATAGFAGSGDRSPKSGSAFDREVAALMEEIDMAVVAASGGEYVRLPEALRRKFETALKMDGLLDDLWNKGGFGDKSGSDQVYALAKRLVKGQGKAFSFTDFGALVWVWDFAAGGKGLTTPEGGGNGDPRALARVWAKALDELAERSFETIDPNDPGVEEAAKAAHESAEEWKAKMAAKAEVEEATVKAGESKVDPEDLWAAKPVPMLPAGLLPGPLDGFAMEFGKALGVDPGGVALGMLATCSAAIRDTIQLEVTSTWSEAARIWGLIVGIPSMKKSPIIVATTRPLQAINKELRSESARELAHWEALSKEDKKLKAEPRRKSILINDATMESVQEVLKAYHDGIITVRDELSGWFGSMEQYANSTSANAIRAFWLQGYNGGPYDVHRVDKRRTGHIPNLSISLFGGIQQDTARRVIDANRQTSIGGANDGLVQRLTPVILQFTGKVDKCAGKQVPGQYEELVKALWRMRTPVDRAAEAASRAEWERMVGDDPPAKEGEEVKPAPPPLPDAGVEAAVQRRGGRGQGDARRRAYQAGEERGARGGQQAGDDLRQA